MDAELYDRWYDTPRGRWIGLREATMVVEHLQPRRGESLLDVGCGTGFFTRTLAASVTGRVVGVDTNPELVEYARRRHAGKVSYEVADARALPFASGSFDLVVSIAALCFIPGEVAAVREIVRVAGRRFAIGLLNRHSILWLQKGRGAGHGGYRGAHWHTAREAKGLFGNVLTSDVSVRTAIHVPSGGRVARFLEGILPSSLPTGGFMLVTGSPVRKP